MNAEMNVEIKKYNTITKETTIYRDSNTVTLNMLQSLVLGISPDYKKNQGLRPRYIGCGQGTDGVAAVTDTALIEEIMTSDNSFQRVYIDDAPYSIDRDHATITFHQIIGEDRYANSTITEMALFRTATSKDALTHVILETPIEKGLHDKIEIFWTITVNTPNDSVSVLLFTSDTNAGKVNFSETGDYSNMKRATKSSHTNVKIYAKPNDGYVFDYWGYYVEDERTKETVLKKLYNESGQSYAQIRDISESMFLMAMWATSSSININPQSLDNNDTLNISLDKNIHIYAFDGNEWSEWGSCSYKNGTHILAKCEVDDDGEENCAYFIGWNELDGWTIVDNIIEGIVSDDTVLVPIIGYYKTASIEVTEDTNEDESERKRVEVALVSNEKETEWGTLAQDIRIKQNTQDVTFAVKIQDKSNIKLKLDYIEDTISGMVIKADEFTYTDVSASVKKWEYTCTLNDNVHFVPHCSRDT